MNYHRENQTENSMSGILQIMPIVFQPTKLFELALEKLYCYSSFFKLGAYQNTSLKLVECWLNEAYLQSNDMRRVL
jgi:hypothetical protein